jgi:hypothetical protein
MRGRIKIFLVIIYILIYSQKSLCQGVDSISFRLNPRLSFYSTEKEGEMLLHVPPLLQHSFLNLRIKVNDREISYWKGIPDRNLIRIPVRLELPEATYSVAAEIFTSGRTRYIAKCPLTILNPKLNEVKTDALTGGVIVNGRIFFPFGFYCYSPVYYTLPEEEAVKGFNMISPYQKILPETFNERKAYMDRCATLGIKVHYNLLSVSGGGGVNSQIEGISENEKMDRLINEIIAFRDHPALLSWYISDEPNGYKLPPEKLEQIYRTVKTADPWHPVSAVFMAPFTSARKYAGGLDIVMADPYPVPNGPVSQVGRITAQLSKEFKGFKPVWIVPQAFGGGEWWGREPSLQELRSMTYQAIINGAKGIQYFIRHGLNSFPKSTASWNECGRMALEISEITPWLLSDESAPQVRTSAGDISVSSYLYMGKTLILAVNTSNKPQKIDIIVGRSTSGTADVIFENRQVHLSSGVLSDFIQAYGSQAYVINNNPVPEKIIPFRGNMITDPGFENLSSPGVPSACYAWNEGDRGATFFTDSREHYEGFHSLRLITPKDKMGTRLRFFPINVKYGRTYMITVWAKADPGPVAQGGKNQIPASIAGQDRKFPYFEIGFSGLGYKRFELNSDWNLFVTSVTIPADTLVPLRTNVMLRMPGSGTGWFDLLQVFEATDINRSINPELSSSWDVE